MDPINPWIDPNETRRMAERLMLPSREPVAVPDNTGFDDSFVGFSEPALDAVIENLAKAPAVGEKPQLGPIAAVKPALENASFFPEQRVMLRERFSALAAFMANPLGDLVFNDGNFGAFHFVLSNLAKSGAEPVHMRLKVGARAVLEIIPIESDGGHSWLGVVLPKLLSQDAVCQIRLHWLGAE